MWRPLNLFIVTIISLLFLLAFSQLAFNSFYIACLTRWSSEWSEKKLGLPTSVAEQLVLRARNRALLYDGLIEKNHLVGGLVVNRGRDHEILDECDSLLFSSVRWVSLRKFGWEERSLRALDSLRKAQVEGDWIRHPECPDRVLSRDMLMGVLIVLSQYPANFVEDLGRLISRIDLGGGYFSNGPSYVSYLTPGLGKIIRMLANTAKTDFGEIPIVIKDGYSTNEWSLLVMKPGYEAHLAGLSLWLEIEIGKASESAEYLRFWEHVTSGLIRVFSGKDPFRQVHQWGALRLLQVDSRNLFFRYLWFRSIGALNGKVASQLLAELLSMPQFPQDRLPDSCDRSADFLWQRRSDEYDEINPSCHRRFSGTDFLWMASLLVEAIEADQNIHLAGPVR